MVTIGIIKNPLFGGGGGANTPIDFLELRLIARGSQNGIGNTGPLKIGDFVEGMKDANTEWKSAMYNGGDPLDRASYTPIVEIILNEANEVVPPYVPPVIPVTTPDYAPEHYSPGHYSTT